MQATCTQIVVTFIFICQFCLTIWLAPCKACRFPQTMYNTDPLYSWEIKSKDPHSRIDHWHQLVTFLRGEMKVELLLSMSPKETAWSYSYICKEKLDNEKYLVKRQRPGKSDKYTCLQFVERDLNVVQLKVGPLKKREDESLCKDETLFLLDAPLVYYHRFFYADARNKRLEHKKCPIDGGYIVTWYNDTGTPQCKDTIPPYKVENECVLGEGLHFRNIDKHSKICRGPDLLHDSMSGIDVHYDCLAFWEEGYYIFMILMTSQVTKYTNPCIRFLTKHGDKFEAYFFKDGICDMTVDITESKSYIRMTFQKFLVHGACADETLACTALSRENCEVTLLTDMCRHTCNLCPGNHGLNNQKLPDVYQGKWLRQIPGLSDEIWEIKGSNIHIPSLGDYKAVGESHCLGWFSFSQDLKGHNYHLIADYQNGCTVRTSIISFVNRSESVISYKISQSIIPEFELEMRENHGWILNNNTEHWHCGVSFQQDKPPLYDKYRRNSNGWFNMVKLGSNYAESCKLNSNLTNMRFKALFPSNNICAGDFKITADGKIKLTFKNCENAKYSKNPSEKTSLDIDLPESYEIKCLAKFQGPKDDVFPGLTFLVTESESMRKLVKTNYTCWVFDEKEDTEEVKFYWLPVSLCDPSYAKHMLDWDKMKNAGLPLANLTLRFYSSSGTSLDVFYSSISMVMLSIGLMSLDKHCYWLNIL